MTERAATPPRPPPLPVRPARALAVPFGGTAQRPGWDTLDPGLRARVEATVGGHVTRVRTVGSGFTAAFAGVVDLAGGERRFVKAATRERDGRVFDSYVREGVVASRLPADVPAPRLLSYDAGGDHVALVFEVVDGRPPARPWDPAELAAVLELASVLADILTPAPAAVPDLAPIAEDLPMSTWRAIASGTDRTTLVPTPWVAHVDELAALENDWVEATAGTTMAHLDLRDDNVLLAGDRAYACDWNWPALSAPWVDVSALLGSAYGDGYDADALLAAHPVGGRAEPAAVDAWLAALGGFYLRESQQGTPVPASPWLRAHQTWYAHVTVDWLAERRGW